jgi:hypothetical protein
VAQLVFRYKVKTIGAQADLQQNPLGYEVISYRRDAEVGVISAPPGSKDAAKAKSGEGSE